MNSSKNVMKNLSKIVMAGLLLFSVTSCNDDDETPDPVPATTITDVMANNPNFSILKTAVVKAGLSETLAGSGTFTVFAPDNDAFAAAGISSADIDKLSSDALKDILLYHTLESKVEAANVPAGPNAPVKTIGGKSIYLTNKSAGVYVNGVAVKQGNVMASNGVIHVISNVLMPPVANLVEAAQANENLSFLVAAAVRASQGSTNIVQALSATDSLTVFAPTNQAFKDAGFPDVASIQAADPNTLAATSGKPVIGSKAFSSDLVNDANLPTLNGGTVKIGLGETATIKGASNANPAKITAVNIVTTNGVVHVIDQVLLP